MMNNVLKLLASIVLLLLLAQVVAADEADDLIAKGNSYRSAGRYDEALDLYSQAILLKPNESSVYLPKYDLMGKVGRFEEAEKVWDQVMEKLPNSTEPIFYYSFVAGGSMMCADYHSKGKNDIIYQKNYQEALFYFGRVHELCPNDTDIGNVYADEGYALYKLGRLNESLQAYDRAFQISQQKLASDPKREQYMTNSEIATYNRQIISTKVQGPPASPSPAATMDPTPPQTQGLPPETSPEETLGDAQGIPIPWFLPFAGILCGFLILRWKHRYR